jgi:hypothetical protein
MVQPKKSGLIIYALAYTQKPLLDPSGIETLRAECQLIFLVDSEKPAVLGTLEPFIESRIDLCSADILENPDIFRALLLEDDYASFHGHDAQHCIVLSRFLPAVRAAHEAGMHALWLCNDDDPLSEAFHYRDEQPSGEAKPALTFIQEITALWEPFTAKGMRRQNRETKPRVN